MFGSILCSDPVLSESFYGIGYQGNVVSIECLDVVVARGNAFATNLKMTKQNDQF